ncbi:reverse transcriptase domain-containing protein, partial [Tanacetum coccineum]
KFASTFKSLLSNKEKLFELANTPLNENCSAVLLKQLPKKLGDLDKFIIPCDFPELDECLALADLGSSINLMPLSMWKKLLVPELTPTRMTLELADRSVAHLKALIDIHGEELTLRVNDEAIMFKVGHTSRYSRNYYDETVHQVNVIDVACKEYAQEVLGFLDSSTSGNPTPSDPIIAFSSPSFTPFKRGDFILEEIETCLLSDSIPPGIDDADFDSEGDIHLLKKLLNDDPSSPLPPKELNIEELKTIKSSIDDPSELRLILNTLENDDNELIPTRLVIGWRVCIDYHKLNDATRKDHFSLPFMDQMLERLAGNEYYCFLDGFSGYFQFLLTRKTKRRPPSLALMGRLPTDACLSVYVMLWARSKEFDVIIRDKKGAKNLAADHLSRLENPHQGDLEKKEINETFPLDTLGMISFYGDSSTPWFADIENSHAGILFISNKRHNMSSNRF